MAKFYLTIIFFLFFFISCSSNELGGLGIQITQTKEIITTSNPIVILNVVEDSNAEQAGLMQGDILLAVNGKSVEGKKCKYVVNKMLRGKIGTMVDVEVLRDKKIIVFTFPRGKIVLE